MVSFCQIGEETRASPEASQKCKYPSRELTSTEFITELIEPPFRIHAADAFTSRPQRLPGCSRNYTLNGLSSEVIVALPPRSDVVGSESGGETTEIFSNRIAERVLSNRDCRALPATDRRARGIAQRDGAIDLLNNDPVCSALVDPWRLGRAVHMRVPLVTTAFACHDPRVNPHECAHQSVVI